MYRPIPRATTAVVVLGLILASCSGAAIVGTVPSTTPDPHESPEVLRAPTPPKNPTTTPEPTKPDPHESPEVLRARTSPEYPAHVVRTALTAWSNGDRLTFNRQLAETALWFNLPLDGEMGRRQFEFQWGFNTTLRARFSDLRCGDSNREDAVSGGTVIECSGRFSDIRNEALGTNPATFVAEYGVKNGRIVNAMSFRATRDDVAIAALEFMSAYLTGLGNDYGQACDSAAGSSGSSCAEFILSHVPEIVEAWDDADEASSE